MAIRISRRSCQPAERVGCCHGARPVDPTANPFSLSFAFSLRSSADAVVEARRNAYREPAAHAHMFPVLRSFRPGRLPTHRWPSMGVARPRGAARFTPEVAHASCNDSRRGGQLHRLCTTGYIDLPLSKDAAERLCIGGSAIAVHYRQARGGRCIDVGPVDVKPGSEGSEPRRARSTRRAADRDSRQATDGHGWIRIGVE